MQDQQGFQAVGGQLHRVVYEVVDQESIESELQGQLDAAQVAYSTTSQARQQAEQVCADAEAVADQANASLDAAKLAEEEAESSLQKSALVRDDFARAKQLAAEQLEQAGTEDSDTGADEDDEAESDESETIDVTDRITVA